MKPWLLPFALGVVAGVVSLASLTAAILGYRYRGEDGRR